MAPNNLLCWEADAASTDGAQRRSVSLCTLLLGYGVFGLQSLEQALLYQIILVAQVLVERLPLLS
jgi:hypothetical protein